MVGFGSKPARVPEWQSLMASLGGFRHGPQEKTRGGVVPKRNFRSIHLKYASAASRRQVRGNDGVSREKA
jgi:hypothetical protein